MNENSKRETGRTAQLSNIAAARAVSGVVRSTLGPRSMLKMLLDPMGGIVRFIAVNSWSSLTILYSIFTGDH